MRSIWLASAALIFSAGAAFAQPTPPTPPTGPANMPATPPGAMAAPKPAMPPGHWLKGPLPENAPPDVYLHIAKASLAHHNPGRADDALSHAETLLLTRAVDQGPTIPVDDSPQVKAIEQARQALHAKNYMAASQQIDAAMGAGHPPPPGGMAPPAPAPQGAMAPPAPAPQQE
ncbi:hypothetical protein [Acidocella sp.]|uniref:hypothetical protein n=1 Tax=Acidocella sp. TaxID=50710 RepID=UPI003D06349F